MPTVTGIATSFIDFTRASNATVTDSDGKVKWAPHNLLTNSESFDAASWTKGTGAVVAANTTSSPNGATTADRLTASVGTTNHWLTQDTGVSIANRTVSVFAKAGTVNWIALGYGNGNAAEQSYFDLANVALGSVPAGMTSSIVDVGSGWRLCSTTFSASYTSIYISIGVYQSNAQALAWNAAGTENVFLWGASLYRSDLGGMQPNTSAYPLYNPTTPKNLLGYTEEYSGTGWARSSVTVSGPVVAPNGLSTADTITSTSSVATTVGIYNAISFGIGSTISIYAKAGTSNIAWVSSDAAQSYAIFNLATESVIASANGTPSITPVGGGWYRMSVSNVTVAGTYFIAGGKDSYTSGAPWGNGTWTSGNTVHLWGAQVSDSASLDTYAPVYGAAVTSAAYYGPRRDFDPVTLACKGLLVEELRTNLFLYSAAFDNAAWQKGGLNAFGSGSVANTTATASPTGAFDASFIQENTSTSTHEIRQVSITVTSGISYTGSIYVKAAGRTRVQFQYFDGTANAYPSFNISTGTLIAANGADATSIVPVGNGWYRISVTKTSASTSASIYLYMDNGSGTSYTGDGTSGIYIWGAQLDSVSGGNAPFATSYIPVGATSAGATRNADVASVSTQAFPYSATEGSIVVNASSPCIAAIANMITLDNGTTQERIRLLTDVASVKTIVTQSNTTQANLSPGSATANTPFKFSVAYKVNDFAAVVNGSAAATYPTGNVPVVNIARLGADSSGNYLNGHIRQITYLPRRISNAELVTRST